MLIGSSAAKVWFPDFREPKDVDYFYPTPRAGAETFWHPDFAGWFSTRVIAFPRELYTIKVSHAFWDLKNKSWEKHMHDILFFQSKGLKIDGLMYGMLYKVWEETHGKKKANLEASPEDFFNKNVKRIYDHDSIHASIAYHDRPLFEKILRDGHEVAVDKSKFDALDYEDKLRLVREEVYATALERLVIPADYSYSPRAAYAWALKKTITSFSKGWFPLFIVLNYTQLFKPDKDYVRVHRENSDKLIPLEG